MSRNFMSKNDELRKGDSLMANNGEFKAVFQNDGNFVVYGWQPMWSSDTAGDQSYRLCMQSDCNLVILNKEGSSIWNTGTSSDKCNMCHLQLTDDGTLFLYREGSVLWQSKK